MRRFRDAPWLLATWLLALLAAAPPQLCRAQGSVSTGALKVDSAEALQAAINLGTPLIQVTEHLDASAVNAGTPNVGVFTFPASMTEIVIWGTCVDRAPGQYPTLDVYDRISQLKQTGSCGVFSAAPAGATGASRALFNVTTGRLVLSNLMLHTAFTYTTAAAPGKLAFGVSVTNAWLWMINTVSAGFAQSALYSLDSHVFMIHSYTYQKGPGLRPELAVNFLLQSESEEDLTLFVSDTVFHADVMNSYAPVYVGAHDPPGTNTTTDGLHESSAPLRARALVAMHTSLTHIHGLAPSDPTGIRGTCSPGVCVAFASGAQPSLYLNATSPDNDPYFAVLPQFAARSMPVAVRDVRDLTWAAVVPDQAAHAAWVASLEQAGVYGADMLLNPINPDAASTTATPPTISAPKSKSNAGLIAGVSIAAVLAVLAAVIAAAILLRRRKRRAAAADETGKAQDAHAAVTVGGPGKGPGSTAGPWPSASDAYSDGPGPPPGGGVVYGSSEFADGGSYTRQDWAPEGGPYPGERAAYGHPPPAAWDPNGGRYLHPAGAASMGPHYAPRQQHREPYNPISLPHAAPDRAVAPWDLHAAPPPPVALLKNPASVWVADSVAMTAEGPRWTSDVVKTDVKTVTASTPGAAEEGGGEGEAVPNLIDAVEKQLDLIEEHADGVLMKRYKLTGEYNRRYGGQGVVQFATMLFNSSRSVAIKFFVSRDAFDNEQALFLDSRLHNVLPPVEDVVSNTDNCAMDPVGRPLPPFVVMERGESLDEWSKRQVPDFASCMQIIMHLAERVGELHGLGIVHRDLKHTNTIWLGSRNAWTIIDFGSSAKIGSQARLSLTLNCAPPESVAAMLSQDAMVPCDAALDVWGVAFMAYELLTGAPVFAKGPDIYDRVVAAMTGKTKLPWEDFGSPTYGAQMRKLGFMQSTLLAMLSRDPAKRPSLREVSKAWRRSLQQDTTVSSAKRAAATSMS